ncbi:MAG: hypothetical protein HDQ44_01820 [Desulfovibrio sp.]|nr:hypothetical protein [Desulfovibrio sp.]
MLLIGRLALGPAIAAALLLLSCPLFAASSQGNAVHGDPWAFGQSSQRDDAIWHKGVDGATVGKKALPAPKPREDAADTSRGIGRALEEAGDVRSRLGMSMANETGTWKVTPDQKKLHPDEYIYRDKRHVVRAFADVKAGDDLNISVGPELHIKDEAHGEGPATEDQPDSAFGVGMKFKYDF